MSDKFEPLTENENLKYQLETLASYEKDDLDFPEIEVAYEDEAGVEGFATVCLIGLGEKTLKRIEELEQAVKTIAPWLSASLSCELSNPCDEYKTACDKIFEADK